MEHLPIPAVVKLIREADPAGDAQLLQAFLARRDQAAFAELVRRHGPMVQGVCRRILGDHHDREDAFQATFLLLVRKGPSVRDRERLGAWLHRVACRAALLARSAAARRRAREITVSALPESAVVPTPENADWRRLFDHELGRLPEKYRTAVVLCDLEGLTRREAARQLGVPEGTLSGRLTTAHRLLAKRLTRRGIVVSAAAVAAGLAAEVSAGVPPPALAAVTENPVRAPVIALARGVLNAMLLRKLMLSVAVVLVALLGVAAGMWVGPAMFARPDPQDTPPRPAADGPAQSTPLRADTKPAAPDRPKVQTLAGHAGTVRVVFAPQGKLLATVSDDKTIQVWDAETRTVRHQLLGHLGGIGAAAFSPDGKILVTSDYQTLRAWDVTNGKSLEVLTPPSEVAALAFAPDGKTLATAGGDGKMRLWDLATWKEVRSFGDPPPKDVPLFVPRITFSPDGKHLAVASTEGHPGPSFLRLWDPETGKLQRTLIDASKSDVWGVAFSPDGKLLASGEASGKVTLFETKSWRKLGELDGKDQLRSLAFAADNRTLALGMRRDVQLWDAATGNHKKTLTGHGNWVGSLSFAPGGGVLASGSSDKTARLWAIDPD